MKPTKIVTTIVLITMTTACAPDPFKWLKPRKKVHTSTSTFTPEAPKKTEKKEDVCASEKDTSIAPDAKVQKKVIDVYRKFERVIRYGCQGEVKSDEMETYEFPEYRMTLWPAGNIRAEHYRVDLTNRTTCNSYNQTDSAISGLFQIFTNFGENLLNGDKPNLAFTVNTSPTLLHLHVQKNLDNYLDYKFYSCTKVSDAKPCESPRLMERGTLILTVNYHEESHPEQIRKVDDCQPQPQ